MGPVSCLIVDVLPAGTPTLARHSWLTSLFDVVLPQSHRRTGVPVGVREVAEGEAGVTA